MLRPSDEDAVSVRGNGLLVLGLSFGGRNEGEARILGGSGLGGELRCVPGALASVGAAEVSAEIDGAIGLAAPDGLDGTVEFGVPGAVGDAIERDTGGVAAVHPVAISSAQVREGASEVDVAVVVGGRTHADRSAAQSARNGQIPRGINPAGRRVNDRRAHVGFASDAGEVPGGEQLAVGKSHEGLDLSVEVKSLAGEVPGCDIEGRKPLGGDNGAVFALLHARKVAAHVHGGADLGEGLNLNVSLSHGAVEVARHAPRGTGGVLRDGAGHRRGAYAFVRNTSEGRGVRGDAGTNVGLRIREDGLAALTEEG